MQVEFTKNQELYEITFFTDQFQGPSSFSEAITLIDSLSGDFALDPEVSEDDLKEILSSAKNEKIESFVVEISSEGINFLL